MVGGWVCRVVGQETTVTAQVGENWRPGPGMQP